MGTDRLSEAYELLKKCEVLAENNKHGQAMTFNNLACFYRRTGKLRTAHIFLERALEIE